MAALSSIKGSLVALITPFHGGKVDEKAFKKLVGWQIRNGTQGLVPCGTTGESPTLSHDEHRHVTELCIEVARGQAAVIAGTGSNSTEEAISLTRHAKKAGADAALVVTPYYNKPTQEGLFQHFRAIATSVDIPIFIYNIPPRSVIDMSIETMARLAELPNIVGVKDATCDLARPVRERIAIGPKWIELTGEDATALPYRSVGGHGCISVTCNIAPKSLSKMHALCDKQDYRAAGRINDTLMPLHGALFSETSPGPIKYAASLLGLCEPELRLPLVMPEAATQQRVRQAMTRAGLLKG